MPRIVKLLSWNVNGIRAIHKKGFLDWLASESPDILCLQETKAGPEQLPEDLVRPPGFYSYWHTAEKKGYSGVAVYSKEKPVKVETSMGEERFDREGRLIKLDYNDFVLFDVYFPNGKQNQERLDFKLHFYDAFLEWIDRLRQKNKHLLFCGDINTAHNEIDLARPKENEKVSGFLPIERKWLDRVVANGYIDTFRHSHPSEVAYSWWDLKSRARDRNVGWRIDYVFATREMLYSVRSAFILTHVMGSDHCPVGVELVLK
jgi:exodeoxyribonuclease-3